MMCFKRQGWCGTRGNIIMHFKTPMQVLPCNNRIGVGLTLCHPILIFIPAQPWNKQCMYSTIRFRPSTKSVLHTWR